MLRNLITDEGKYYLYRHVRLDKNEPFYIGFGTKSKRDIKYQTYGRANVNTQRSKLWHRVVNKTTYQTEILIESNNKNFVLEQEKYFVKLYGRKNLNSGSLVNLTDGGESNTGKICTDKLRKTRSKLMKKRWLNLTPQQKIQKINKFTKTNCTKVLNTETGTIHNSINEAYESSPKLFSKSHFTAMLSNKYENKTKYTKYYE